MTAVNLTLATISRQIDLLCYLGRYYFKPYHSILTTKQNFYLSITEYNTSLKIEKYICEKVHWKGALIYFSTRRNNVKENLFTVHYLFLPPFMTSTKTDFE